MLLLIDIIDVKEQRSRQWSPRSWDRFSKFDACTLSNNCFYVDPFFKWWRADRHSRMKCFPYSVRFWKDPLAVYIKSTLHIFLKSCNFLNFPCKGNVPKLTCFGKIYILFKVKNSFRIKETNCVLSLERIRSKLLNLSCLLKS